MPNYNQAPELKHEGKKSQDNKFYQIPQSLADIIFNELGNSSAQLRIMLVLIGTKEGFKVSEQWILDRTGLQHASYITARKALIARGWLSLDNAKSITVNFNNIYPKEKSNMVLPQPSNMVLPQCSNTILPITDNETNKETDNKGEQQKPLAFDCSLPKAPVSKTAEIINQSYNDDGSFKF